MTAVAARDRRQRTDVLGVAVDAVSLAEAVERIERWVAGDDRQYVCVCTAHSIVEAGRSPDVWQALDEAGMVTPDGMPLVWLSRLAGHGRTERVYGPDLMLACLERSTATGCRHYLYGGGPGVAERLADVLRARFPGLQIAGASTPGWGSADDLASAEAAVEINRSGADVVWVGLGAPKQELWMWKMRPRLGARVLVGVGAAFDFHAGTVRQAPRWMQRAGLEWLFRLCKEPRRLWRRYLVSNSRFLFDLACQTLRLKTFER